jgi:hypothetical protein
MADQKARHGSAARDPEDIQQRPPDQYDEDLARDNRRHSGGSTMGDLAHPGADAGLASGPSNATGPGTDQGEFPQHARRGQAESPVEETLNQPEHKREGHHGGARDS